MSYSEDPSFTREQNEELKFYHDYLDKVNKEVAEMEKENERKEIMMKIETELKKAEEKRREKDEKQSTLLNKLYKQIKVLGKKIKTLTNDVKELKESKQS